MKELEPETANLKEMLREAKVALKKSKRVDYYKLLEIDSNANEFELKRAYRCAVDILCGSCSTQSCLSRRTDALLASCVALAEDCRGRPSSFATCGFASAVRQALNMASAQTWAAACAISWLACPLA